MTALDDQAIAGAIMWVPGSLAFLIPLGWIGCHLLYGRDTAVTLQRHKPPTKPRQRGRISLPVMSPDNKNQEKPAVGFDLLQIPGLGKFLHWRYARVVLQLPLFLLAIVIIWDGLVGPQVTPLNLAGVLARILDSNTVGCRQHLLYGLSLSIAEDAGPKMDQGTTDLARMVAWKVAGSGVADRLLLDL